MGDYLLLSWLATRRGITVFVLLVLITVFSNLSRFASQKNDSRCFVRISDTRGSNQRENNQWHADGRRDEKDSHRPKAAKSVRRP